MLQTTLRLYSFSTACLTAEKKLKEQADKIRQQNAQGMFCCFNNDVNANAVKNCLTIKKMLEKPK